MASKRRIRRNLCSSKIRHPDEQAATENAWRMTRTKKVKFTSYKCRLCGGWHIGHAHPTFHAATSTAKRRNIQH